MPVSNFDACGNVVSFNDSIVINFVEDQSSNVIQLDPDIITNFDGVQDISLSISNIDLSNNTYKIINASDGTAVEDLTTLNTLLRSDGIKFTSQPDANSSEFDVTFQIDYDGDDDGGVDANVESVFKVTITEDHLEKLSAIVLGTETFTESSDHEFNSGSSLLDAIKNKVNKDGNNNNTDFYQDLVSDDLKIQFDTVEFNGSGIITDGNVGKFILKVDKDGNGYENADTATKYNLKSVLKIKISDQYGHNWTDAAVNIPFKLYDVDNNLASENGSNLSFKVTKDTLDEVNGDLSVTIDEQDDIANATGGVDLFSGTTLKDTILAQNSGNIDSNNYTDFYSKLNTGDLKIKLDLSNVSAVTNGGADKFDLTFKYGVGQFSDPTTEQSLDGNLGLFISSTNKDAYTNGSVNIPFQLLDNGTKVSKDGSKIQLTVSPKQDDVTWNNSYNGVDLTNLTTAEETILTVADLKNFVNNVDADDLSFTLVGGTVSGTSSTHTIADKAVITIQNFNTDNPSLQVDPQANYSGIFSFDINVNDGDVTVSKTVTVDVTNDNTDTIDNLTIALTTNELGSGGEKPFNNILNLIKTQVSNDHTVAGYTDFYNDLSNGDLQISFTDNTSTFDGSGTTTHGNKGQFRVKYNNGTNTENINNGYKIVICSRYSKWN